MESSPQDPSTGAAKKPPCGRLVAGTIDTSWSFASRRDVPSSLTSSFIFALIMALILSEIWLIARLIFNFLWVERDCGLGWSNIPNSSRRGKVSPCRLSMRCTQSKCRRKRRRRWSCYKWCKTSRCVDCLLCLSLLKIVSRFQFACKTYFYLFCFNECEITRVIDYNDCNHKDKADSDPNCICCFFFHVYTLPVFQIYARFIFNYFD